MSRKLKSENTVSATAQFNLKSAEAAFFMKDALFAATHEVFAEIAMTAAERSPVLAQQSKERFPGELRESIDYHVSKVQKGVKARLFTKTDAEWFTKNKSTVLKGYGAFVELGTAREAAEPYLFPSFAQHIKELPETTRERLDEITGGK